MSKMLFSRKIPSKWLVLITCISLVSVVFFYYGRNVPFDKQWPLYDALRNTSSIIFGVMGAWIALVYPEALSSILEQKENRDIKNKVQEVEKLLSPLIYSTVILASVLLVGIFAPIFKQIPFFTSRVHLFRGISYSLLGMLTLCQLWAVILTLLPADITKRNLNYLQSKQEARNRLLSMAKRELEKK